MMAEFRKASNEFRQTDRERGRGGEIRDATRIEMLGELDAAADARRARPPATSPRRPPPRPSGRARGPDGPRSKRPVAAAVSRETTTAAPIEHK